MVFGKELQLYLKAQQNQISKFMADLIEARLVEEIRSAGNPDRYPEYQRHRAFDSVDHSIETLIAFARLKFPRKTVVRLRAERISKNYLDQALPLFREVLKAADLRVRAWDGELIFFYLPQWSRYKWRFEVDEATERRDQVLAIARDVGLKIIDFDIALQAMESPLEIFPFGMPGHYNPRGYDLLAKQIDNALRQGH